MIDFDQVMECVTLSLGTNAAIETDMLTRLRVALTSALAMRLLSLIVCSHSSF